MIGEKISKTENFLADAVVGGSCPYRFDSRKEASTEATAWTAIALCHKQPLIAKKAIEFLISNQNEDGGWANVPVLKRSDWTSGPAMLAIRLFCAKHEGQIDRAKAKQALFDAFQYLIKSRVDFLSPVARLLLLLAEGPSSQHYGRGWPWTRGCYNWVEPTAYSLMAFKRPTLIKEDLAHPVVYHANKFLLEHACRGGGWNHGAFFCLGEYYRPYVTTSAEALLALVDIPAEKQVISAVDYLKNVSHETHSAMSLSWTILALDAYGCDFQKEYKLLLDMQNADGSFGINYFVTALAFLALNTAHDINPFKAGKW